MANTIFQQPQLPTPALADVVPIGHQADGKGYSATLQAIGSVIGSVGLSISSATQFPGLFYNYGFYVAAQLPSTGAAANATALNTMFTAMSTATPSGGWAWILQQQYPINMQTNGFALPYNSWICGLGGGGTGQKGAPSSVHFSTTGDGVLLSSTGPHTSGGVYLWNLALQAQSPTKTYTCAVLGNTWNCRAMKCNFLGWPIAYWANLLSAGMEQCTVQYSGNVAGTGTTTVNGTLIPSMSGGNYVGYQPVSVILGASQVYCVGPGEHLQVPSRGNGGVANAIGVGVGNNSVGGGSGPVEHAVISNIHISDYTWGLSFIYNAGGGVDGTTGLINGEAPFAGSAGTTGCKYTNVQISAWTSALLLVSPNVNADFFGDAFVSCEFHKSGDSTDGSAIVYIDAGTYGGGSGSINNLSFTDCTIYSNVKGSVTPGANAYGVNLFCCSATRFIGGLIGNMGTTSNGSANVAITGTDVKNIEFIGVHMPRTYAGGASNPSQYAILFTAAPTGVITFDNCNFSGFPTANILQLTAAPATGTLFIRNCVGYNDQGTAVNVVANITTAAYAAYNQAANSGTSYFGPQQVFYTANAGGGTLKLYGGAALTLAANQTGSFWLSSPYDTFQFSLAPAAVQWTGH